MIVPEPDQDLLDALDRRERQPQLAAGLIAIAAAAAVSAVIYELLLHALRLGIQASGDGAGLAFVLAGTALFLGLTRAR